MKIGVLAHHLETRKDLRDFLVLLGQEHDILLYIKQKDARNIGKLMLSVTVVPIPVLTGIRRFLMLIWQYLFLLFGKLPTSVNNYYLTEHIKLSNSFQKKWIRIIQFTLLSISKITPQILTYDQYLNGLSQLKVPFQIEAGIDVFLCFTEISTDWFLAKIIEEHKPVWTYVYSWDHPCKMKTFSNRTNYLVWNEEIKNDLITLQLVDTEKIKIWGAIQFIFLEQFLKPGTKDSESNPYNFPYIYIAAATGYDTLAHQEVKYCCHIANYLQHRLPHWKFVFRPYPFQKNTIVYAPLKSISNVLFDESTTPNDKFQKIKHAKAFFHFGTTLGYEAIYLGTPSFLLDIADKAKDELLHGFVHQYQNDKYLNTKDSLVIKDKSGLVTILENLSHKIPEFYSCQKLTSYTPLRSLIDLKEKFVAIITDTNVVAS